ncbi:hypothetical protein VTK73DRAFT_3910 [Phialemonium thermophilum]|uniref:Uncharacterized protein n=1 Tax=Phialemonium thermophilum TaxID=223376 RepID=A0ABR3VDX8_9PEZI
MCCRWSVLATLRSTERCLQARLGLGLPLRTANRIRVRPAKLGTTCTSIENPPIPHVGIDVQLRHRQSSSSRFRPPSSPRLPKSTRVCAAPWVTPHTSCPSELFRAGLQSLRSSSRAAAEQQWGDWVVEQSQGDYSTIVDLGALPMRAGRPTPAFR